MSQYFEYNPGLKKEYRRLTYRDSGHVFNFTTDNGIFSKDHIDPQSVLLIECIKKYPIRGDVLDMGCGYGAIGIILSKFFKDLCLFQSDINPAAAALAENNCRGNNVVSHIVCSDGYEKLPRSFDWVILNPPIHAGKKAVYRLFRETRDHLRHGEGGFFLVMHKKHGAESALKELAALFASVEVINKKKGVHIIFCTHL